MGFAKLFRIFIHRVGFDIINFSPITSQFGYRDDPLQAPPINLVFDIGANIGQYASSLRCNGYRGRIISFEPLSSAFAALSTRAKDDPNWECVNVCIGNYEGVAKINIAGNSESSSILEMEPKHIMAAPESTYIGKEEVRMTKVDSIIDEYCQGGDSVFLKIDTQGYEKLVIDGAQSSLSRIMGIQLEMSLMPLYKGELPLAQMVGYMHERGFKLTAMKPVFDDPETGELLQVDGLFIRVT